MDRGPAAITTGRGGREEKQVRRCWINHSGGKTPQNSLTTWTTQRGLGAELMDGSTSKSTFGPHPEVFRIGSHAVGPSRSKLGMRPSLGQVMAGQLAPKGPSFQGPIQGLKGPFQMSEPEIKKVPRVAHPPPPKSHPQNCRGGGES